MMKRGLILELKMKMWKIALVNYFSFVYDLCTYLIQMNQLSISYLMTYLTFLCYIF